MGVLLWSARILVPAILIAAAYHGLQQDSGPSGRRQPSVRYVGVRLSQDNTIGVSLDSPNSFDEGKSSIKGAPASLHRIPRIIHQEWKSHSLYPNQRKWREKCQHVNPDWEFRLYNDSENRALLEEHFPWFLPTYDNYPNTINRVDAIRIFYLAKFGGIYMDLDYTCLRPFDDLLKGSQFVVAEDELQHRQNLTNFITKKEGLLGVGNSFLASTPGHVIAMNATKRLQEVRDKVRQETGNLAGVWFIRELVEAFRPRFAELGVTVLPMTAVSPMHWVRAADHRYAAQICTELADAEKCRARFPNSTTISFWTGTWQTGGPRDDRKSKIEIDKGRQALLGLRTFNDRSDIPLAELERRANYTGPGGALKIIKT